MVRVCAKESGRVGAGVESGAGEARLPPLRARCNPLGEIRRVAQALLDLAFVIHGQAEAVDQALPKRGPDGAHRQGARACDGARKCDGRGEEVLLFADHDVTQAKGPSFVAPHPTSRIEQLGRVLLADDAGKGHRQSEPVMKTEAARNWH